MRANASALLVLLASALPLAVSAQAVSTATPPQPSSPKVVYLDGAADLEQLRQTNLPHYLRAKKILASANEICRPKPDHTFLALFGSDPHCAAMMWKTSLPPKKQLSFRLDDVQYIALVTITDATGKYVDIDTPTR